MKVETHNGEPERSILIALIVSTPALTKIAPKLSKSLFRSEWSDLIAGWCGEYFKKYGTAPGNAIEPLYVKWCETAQDEDVKKTINRLIASLSSQYEALAEGIDTKFMVDRATDYFNQIAVEKHIDSLKADMERGHFEKAVVQAESFKRLQLNTPPFIDLLTDKEAQRLAIERKQNVLIKYKGGLGEFFGDELSEESLICLVAPMKIGKCVAGYTPIMLVDGSIKTIQQIVEDRIKVTILSFNIASQRFEPRLISKVWTNGTKECWEVTTRTGRSITTTLNHQYLTTDGWKLLEQIAVGERIAVPKRLAYFGDCLLPEAEVKFLAYMLAEGGCTINGLVFTNADPILNADFQNSCGTLGIKFRKRGKYGTGLRGTRQLKNKYPMSLEKVSSKTKLIPPQIFTCPRKQVALFLRVFFSCDGCIMDDKIEMTLANKPMLKQISHLLLRFGIVHRLYFRWSGCNGKRFRSWRIDISSREYIDIFLREINFLTYKTKPVPEHDSEFGRSYLDRIPWQVAEEMYEGLRLESFQLDGEVPDKGSYLRPNHKLITMLGGNRRKAEHLRDFIKKKTTVTRAAFSCAPLSSPTIQKYLGSDVLWDEVVSIKKVADQPTYDLTVPELANFVAGDCIVHNSFWELDLAWQGLRLGRKIAYFQVGDLSQDQIVRRFHARAAYRPLKRRAVNFPIMITPSQFGLSQIDMEVKVYDEDLTVVQGHRAFEKAANRHGSDMFRLSWHATKSVSIADIENILTSWSEEGWHAQVVVVDYSENLAPVNPKSMPLDQVEETWAIMSRLREKLRCCLITAIQTNREGFASWVLTRKNFSKNKMIFSHCTAAIGLNRTDEEASKQIMRLNFIVRREEAFSETLCCFVGECRDLCHTSVVSSFHNPGGIH